MELPDSLNKILGNGSGAGSEPDPDADPERKAQQMDGGQIVAEGGEEISIQIPDDADVEPEQIQAALNGNAGSVNVAGAADGDTTVTPVASGSDIHITDSAFDLSNWEYQAHLDDRVKNLMENQVDYNQQMAQWMLANDDLIPGILIRLKSIILGDEGLEVDPEDPDDAMDQRLAEHQREIYSGDAEVGPHVDPQRVVDRILEQNVMNAVWVGRSTDLQHLDVDDLSYVKDGETGREIYIQQPTGYTTFDIDDQGDPSVEFESTDRSQALEIGEQVVDVRLYRSPPLQAVADDVVNKQQLKRLQGRKAEIASIGGIIIRVNPPAWLDEEDYGNYIREEDDQFGDSDGRLLELVMAQQIEAALETLQDYQTATVMSIPENWETDTIELPEMNESMADMIRGYNQAIARRLLLPLDLLELEKGSELSRNTMMSMFVNMIRGWQGQITAMFDQFARIQADIHGIDGQVKHSLPSIESEDETEITQLLNFAGLLGLSDSEARELANTLEGVDLDTDTDADLDMPEPGGPEDPEEREQQMQEMQRNQPPEPGDGGDEPQGDGPEDGMQADRSKYSSGEPPEGFPTTCRSCGERTRMKGNFTCPVCHDDVDADEFDGELAAAAPEGSIMFGNMGGDPFGDEDVLEAFVQELLDVGADGVWLGDEQWPDHTGIHDRPVSVSGLSMDAAQDVWDQFIDESAALGGPRQMQAQGSSPEGWQQVDHVEAAHAISAPTMREAAVKVRDVAERQTPEGYSTEMKKLDDDTFSVLVRDREGNFRGSMRIREDPTRDGQWVITGADEFVFSGSQADPASEEAAGE